jgi:IS30 family transposase
LERLTSENTNELFRDYYPKGTDLKLKYIKRMSRSLNSTQRKT